MDLWLAANNIRWAKPRFSSFLLTWFFVCTWESKINCSSLWPIFTTEIPLGEWVIILISPSKSVLIALGVKNIPWIVVLLLPNNNPTVPLTKVYKQTPVGLHPHFRSLNYLDSWAEICLLLLRWGTEWISLQDRLLDCPTDFSRGLRWAPLIVFIKESPLDASLWLHSLAQCFPLLPLGHHLGSFLTPLLGHCLTWCPFWPYPKKFQGGPVTVLLPGPWSL